MSLRMVRSKNMDLYRTVPASSVCRRMAAHAWGSICASKEARSFEPSVHTAWISSVASSDSEGQHGREGQRIRTLEGCTEKWYCNCGETAYSGGWSQRHSLGHKLRSSSQGLLTTPKSNTATYGDRAFQLPPQGFGTHYHVTSGMRSLSAILCLY